MDINRRDFLVAGALGLAAAGLPRMVRGACSAGPHPSSLPIGLSLVTPGDTVNTWILSCPRMRIAWETQIQQLHSLEPTEQYQALIIYIFRVLLEIYRVPPGSARARI